MRHGLSLRVDINKFILRVYIFVVQVNVTLIISRSDIHPLDSRVYVTMVGNGRRTKQQNSQPFSDIFFIALVVKFGAEYNMTSQWPNHL